MTKRDGWTEEARAREREANRLRMRRMLADPAYRTKVNARRREQDASRKAADPELRAQRRANGKRYYDRRHGDPEFEAKRVAQAKRWRHERRAAEQFDAILAESEQP